MGYDKFYQMSHQNVIISFFCFSSIGIWTGTIHNINIYIYIYMTSGGLCPGEDFAWCSLCRRLSGCRGVYFPSRRFRYVDNKCMSVYVARLQNPSHLQYALGNYPTHSGLIFTISWTIYIYIYIYTYIYTHSGLIFTISWKI